MSLIQTEAIVLGNKALGDSDQLIRLLTLHHGKVTGVAKGGRRAKNRFGSSLIPMSHIHLSMFERRTGGLFQIQDTEIIQSFQRLREDLDTIFCASHFLRWIDAFVPEGEPRSASFELLHCFLGLLRKGKNLDGLARCFEVRLLDLSGYRPRLDICAKCECVLEKRAVVFSLSDGRGFCDACCSSSGPSFSRLSPGAVASIHQILTLHPEKMNRLQLRGVLKNELQCMTQSYAKHLLGKEIGFEQQFCHSTS